MEAILSAAKVLVQLGTYVMGAQIGVNFLMAFGFSKINMFIISLQVLIYSSFLIDLLFPENVEAILSIYTFIAQLDIISEDISNFFYERILRLQFSEEDQAHESL